MVVAIDGPAGSGKSTLARLLAGRLGFRFLDSGAMYRALTLKALLEGVDPGDEPGLTVLLERSDIRLQDDEKGQHAFLDGADVSGPIRGPDVNASVSAVAAHGRVRDGIVKLQKEYVERVLRAGSPGVVVEGRDMATVVFPDARVKFYLDAAPETRARRRAAQAGTTAEDERASIEARDATDTGRMVAPLRAALDAVRVDTTDKTVEQALAVLLEAVGQRLKG